MDTSIGWLLLLQVVLIALNAVFACAEIAVLSVNEVKLSKMVSEGNRKARRLSRLTAQPARFLATIQVAITLAGFLGSAFAAENFSDPLVDWLVGLGVTIPPATLNTLAVILITLILSFFTLVFGELVPKRIAMKQSEKVALNISGLITVISKLFAPIVWLLSASTNGILRLLGIDPNEAEEQVGEEDIRMMVDASSEHGGIDHEEKEFIQNVFEFDDLTAEEIATHRTDVDLLWLDDTMDDWAETIHNTRHTRYPVCEDSADNVVGILNAKEYFRLADKSRESVMARRRVRRRRVGGAAGRDAEPAAPHRHGSAVAFGAGRRHGRGRSADARTGANRTARRRSALLPNAADWPQRAALRPGPADGRRNDAAARPGVSSA